MAEDLGGGLALQGAAARLSHALPGSIRRRSPQESALRRTANANSSGTLRDHSRPCTLRAGSRKARFPRTTLSGSCLNVCQGTGARPLSGQEVCGLLGLGLTGPLPGRDWDETARAGLKEPPLTLAEAATVWAAKVLTAPDTGPQPVESVKAGVCTLSWDAHTRERFLGWVDQRRADRAEGEPSQAAARSAPGSGRDPPESTRERTPVSSGTLGPSAKQAELEASKLMSSWVDGSSHQLTPDRRAGGPPKGKGGKGPQGKRW